MKKIKRITTYGNNEDVPKDLIFQFKNGNFISAKWNFTNEVPDSIEYTYKRITPKNPYLTKR